MPLCDELRSDELEAVYDGLPFEGKVVQLSAGRLGWRNRVTDLEGVVVRWTSFDQAVRVREVLTGPVLNVSVATGASSPPRFFGREIEPGDLLVQHPCDDAAEFVTAPDTHGVAIDVDPELFPNLEEWLAPVALVRLPRRAVAGLTRVCREVAVESRRVAKGRG